MTAMTMDETPFLFGCEGEQLVGVLAAPATPAPKGVLIVVGGPQYRVGGHRQFVQLARHLARSGIPSLRFDYRGMGDSSGAMRSFEDVTPDIHAAIDAFFARVPGLRSVVLWGLCDAASAACLYAPTDARVSGVVLVNPWVQTAAVQARTQLRHYYLTRLLKPAFWGKFVHGRVDVRDAISSILRAIRTASRWGTDEPSAGPAGTGSESIPLPERMARGLNAFPGRTLVILSGRDHTAREFELASRLSATWISVLRTARREDLPGADHTFSARVWKERVADLTAAWVTREC